MTNFQKWKSALMLEELADMLGKLAYCRDCVPEIRDSCSNAAAGSNCRQNIIAWGEQEAKDD